MKTIHNAVVGDEDNFLIIILSVCLTIYTIPICRQILENLPTQLLKKKN